MGTWKKKKQIDLNPSGADRWTTCTASPKYIFDNWDKIPDQDTNFSREGTTAHEVAAAMLQNRQPREKDNYTCPVPIEPEMRWHAFNYWDYVTGLIEDFSITFVETKFPLWYNPSRNALVDFGVIQNSGLHIVDYKYGEGVIVSPVNNLQGMIYARSLVENEIARSEGLPRDDWPVTIHIYQPRTRDDKPAHAWETTWGEVKGITDAEVGQAAYHIQHGAAEGIIKFAPSEKACQFCPAKGFCEARPALYTQDLEMLATLEKPSLPDTLTEKQLVAILRYGDQLKKWIGDRQAFALQHMRAGGKVPGFKLVTSRGGNRYWTDEKKAAKYLLADTILRDDEVYTEPKLVGPATIEKLIGKKKFPKRVFELIGKPPGQPIIATEDDPRPSCLVDGTEDFEDLGVDLEVEES